MQRGDKKKGKGVIHKETKQEAIHLKNSDMVGHKENLWRRNVRLGGAKKWVR